MKLSTPQRGSTLVPALVAFMVLATVGVSLAGSGSFTPHPDAKVSVSDGPRAGHRDDDGPGGQVGSSAAGDTSVETTSSDEAAGCAAALEAGTAAIERKLGLDRAVEVILEDCARGGHVQGLLNALAHLQRNQERQGQNENAHGQNENANGPNENANGQNENANGPNENANEGANGPGGQADPANAEAPSGDEQPDESGRSSSRANGNAGGGSSPH